MPKKIYLQDVISKSNIVHDNFYDYSKSIYIDSKTKMEIGCPVHGYFWQSPNHHMKGSGCSKCGTEKTANKIIEKKRKLFVKRSTLKHGIYYDYSRILYINNQTKVEIGCPKHGYFSQTPHDHLSGCGCPKCGRIKYSETRIKNRGHNIIDELNLIHNYFYDYSLFLYIGIMKESIIICPIHGEFTQIVIDHVNGSGCPKCGRISCGNKQTQLAFNQYVKKAEMVHGIYYDYSTIKYINNKTKIEIRCPKHGYFWQIANDHLNGAGCPICKQSKGEKRITELLEKYNINYERQYKKKRYRFDFYLPDYNAVIEYHGRQHFISIDFFGGEKEFKKTIKRDQKKYQICKELNIQYIVIEKENLMDIEKLLKEKLDSGESDLLYEGSNFEERRKKYIA